MRRSARLVATSRCVKAKTSRPISSVTKSSVASVAALSSHLHQKVENLDSDDWVSLCSTRELSCAITLESGQVFSWRRHPSISAMWLGVINRQVFALRERDTMVQFRCLHPSDLSHQKGLNTLSHYFRLDVSLDPLYERWTERKDRMTKIIEKFRGLRIVRQDPVECLFSFICSSNNNIARIQGMVDTLKMTYGDCLYESDSSSFSNKAQRLFYAFPSLNTLATKCDEAKLRALGFGYRAPFIVKSAKQLQELGGASYLYTLRDEKLNLQREAETIENSEYSYQEKLMVFRGVGRKVADCVALFSLEKMEAIPVDTHVWQIACRELDPTLSDRKSITPKVYRLVGDLFRLRFAPQAGWAHSILFAGDLQIKGVGGENKNTSEAKKKGTKRKLKLTTDGNETNL